MDNSLKQRLIGAILLLTAVVIVAIFLVNSANDGIEDSVQTIQPDFVSSVNTEHEEVAVVEPEVLLDPHKLEASSESKKVEQSITSSRPEVKKAVIEPKAAKQEVKKEATVATVPEPKPETKPVQTTVEATDNKSVSLEPQWVIQLASFSQQANAKALEKKVAGLGLKAHIEEVTSNNKTNYRVRIGPESDRGRIDQIVKKVSESLALKPQVLTVKTN